MTERVCLLWREAGKPNEPSENFFVDNLGIM